MWPHIWGYDSPYLSHEPKPKCNHVWLIEWSLPSTYPNFGFVYTGADAVSGAGPNLKSVKISQVSDQKTIQQVIIRAKSHKSRGQQQKANQQDF